MDTVVTPAKEFAKNSTRLVKRCTKPDRKGEKPFQSPCIDSTKYMNWEYGLVRMTAPYSYEPETK